MNVIIRRWPVSRPVYRSLRRDELDRRGRYVADDHVVKIHIEGVVKAIGIIEIEESMWLRMCQFQGTKDWAATRRENKVDGTPKYLQIDINADGWLGVARGRGYLTLWREGNRQLCSFKIGVIEVGNFHWRIDGEPVGKIPRKPRKKHPKPVVL